MYICIAETCYQARQWLLTPEAINWSRLIQGLAFAVAFAAVRWHKQPNRTTRQRAGGWLLE